MPETHTPAPTDPTIFTETILERLERIARMEAISSLQGKRIDDHDQVLADIREHLKQLVERVDKFQNRLLIAAALLLGGSHNAGELAKAFLQQLQ